MKKVQCTNSNTPHWFDMDKSKVCPHCGAPAKGGNLGKEQKAQAEDIGETGSGKSKKDGIFGFLIKSSKGKEVSNVKESVSLKPTGEVFVEDNSSKTYSDEAYPPTGVLIKPPETDISKRKTIDDIKTVSSYGYVHGREPVTGWLVGIKGEYKGESFNLRAGVNIIGRDENAYVNLRGDAQVSRNKHASIIYEPKKKIFLVGEGENSLTYYNGELLYGKHELNAYDTIEIGAGTYMFIPFCGEHFSWDIDKETEKENAD